MSGMLLIFAGIAMAGSMFAMMQRVNMRRCLGYATWLDICFTILMFVILGHTFSGAVSGAVAGLCLALGLSVLRKTMGYERLKRDRWKLVWVSTPPTWTVDKMKQLMKEKIDA